jgi:hypothetical protein
MPSPQGQQPKHHQQAPSPQPVVQTDQDDGEPSPITADAQVLSQAATQQSAPGQPGAPRKRRRRRGRRGGSGHPSGGPLPVSQQGPQSNGHDRFGTSDEVDTTPQEQHAHQKQTGHEIATPNASSTPVWSLAAEREDAGSRPKEISGSTVRAQESGPAPESVAVAPPGSAPERSQQPTKKGWWQRAFRSEE